MYTKICGMCNTKFYCTGYYMINGKRREWFCFHLIEPRKKDLLSTDCLCPNCDNKWKLNNWCYGKYFTEEECIAREL
jgi:hypothetical protein